MKQSRDEKILFDFYRRVYKAATPSADFDELLENATINERGQKEIDYNAYEIDEEIMDQIIKDIFKQYRVPVYRRKAFNFEFHLGCGPKTKLNRE
jgi:hypothetical protein